MHPFSCIYLFVGEGLDPPGNFKEIVLPKAIVFIYFPAENPEIFKISGGRLKNLPYSISFKKAHH